MHSLAKVKKPPLEALDYPHAQPPAPCALCEVASGVYWLRMPLPFALEHINLWLLADGDGWTIVDCGFGSDETRALWEQIMATGLHGRPVTRILITHFHPDHFGLAAWLAERWQIPVSMTEPEFAAAEAWHTARGLYTRDAHLALHRLHGLSHDAAARAARMSRENLFRRGVAALPDRIVPLHDGDELRINGRAWRVECGYGHSPAHATFHSTELGVLIAGDMVLPRISTNVSLQPHSPEADPLGQFLDSLAHYAELDATTLILPSHGLPFYGVRPRTAALREHHEQRLQELIVGCDEPRTGGELMPLIFKRQLDVQQTFFAMGETLAHLNYLKHRAQLARVTDANGIYRFVRA